MGLITHLLFFCKNVSIIIIKGDDIVSSYKNANHKAQNPMSEYLLKLQLIVNNTEFKDKELADKYETYETKQYGNAYVNAVLKKDSYNSYEYDDVYVYNTLINNGIDEDTAYKYMKNPNMIPPKIKGIMLEESRAKRIASYVEPNKYYAMLTGKPFQGTEKIRPEKVILIPDEFFEMYRYDGVISRSQPIHEMPAKYQELFMNSPYYEQVINANPNAKYLKYIGSNAIPIHVSRPANDGEILRINESKLTTYNEIFGNISVSPDIVHKYVNIYNETRNYVYNTLSGDFSGIYKNYNSFIRFLTIYLSIGNAMNEFMKKSANMIYMNNVTAHDFFMLYGLPSAIMEGKTMMKFLKQFRLILMDKGTNVVYRVKDLIGYEYTDIYTLVMVKQQIFQDGVPVYKYIDGKAIPEQEIVFRRLGTTDENTSYFQFKESRTTYSREEITSGDPRWWECEEVRQMINDMNYTLSNSKYIQLSTHMSMADVWWQCVILLRGLLDNKSETQLSKISLCVSANDTSDMTVFDAVLVLIILMNNQLKDFKGNPIQGNIYLTNGIYNGTAECVDMLFNGLYQGIPYIKGFSYHKGQYIGERTVDGEVILYEVINNFVGDISIEEELLNGNIKLSDKEEASPKELVKGLPFKVASFDFKLRENKPEFYKSIPDKKYIEPDVLLPMLDKVLDRANNNIGEVLMSDVKKIYKYLEEKLRDATTIHQFRQVTDMYYNLFLVDPVRDEWYDSLGFEIDEILMDSYNITQFELDAFKSFYSSSNKDSSNLVTFEYNKQTYNIPLYDILNKNVCNIEINNEKPFNDNGFVEAFNKYIKNEFVSNSLLSCPGMSQNIKTSYKSIIVDKVTLDVGNTPNGPKTFDSLLFRSNPSLYKYIMTLKTNSDASIMLMRAIVKALEDYTNTSLSGLTFKTLGESEYIRILKEVITYFKSYMVEFSKEEFVYVFDGLLDNGGNSNMLNLYDEIVSGDINVLPHDSLTLFDVSCADVHIGMKDDNSHMLHDEAIFRLQGTYQSFLDTGYEIWYDDGKRIVRTPMNINPSTNVIANIISVKENDSSVSYKIIINKNNVDTIPPGYYGNVL